MTKDVKSLAEFNEIQARLSPEIALIVLFFFDRFDEESNRMGRYVDLMSDDFIDRVLFLTCNKESHNHDIFEKYNIETIPTFLFIKNNEQAAPPYTGPDALSVDKIETAINDLINGKT
ncbi:unnamed protein product [Rotaria magnacalcarata]|uniref:Thioredoxin domain-containing protein n=3 Tax=Rotaria magnacalcarata TaxID=392030 RepID=A0A816UMW1_9BILA|nr:unnamed protein product [Rotaria magnacalcarata]CAF2111042.1 unnamed protein product [Rotaria magnacalcarata]CAF4154676.1 unnamed protein product [Rotaria magnacalcarata]CAF4494537.1 unnamed protein product [Rotaria magnacalcarata]